MLCHYCMIEYVSERWFFEPFMNLESCMGVQVVRPLVRNASNNLVIHSLRSRGWLEELRQLWYAGDTMCYSWSLVLLNAVVLGKQHLLLIHPLQCALGIFACCRTWSPKTKPFWLTSTKTNSFMKRSQPFSDGFQDKIQLSVDSHGDVGRQLSCYPLEWPLGYPPSRKSDNHWLISWWVTF